MIGWKPQPGPQTMFCQSPAFECLYGGAVGGGKTDALLVEGLRQVNNPNYWAILFRRTTKELFWVIERSRQLFPALVPGCRFNQTEKVWTFPSGAKYFLSHM